MNNRRRYIVLGASVAVVGCGALESGEASTSPEAVASGASSVASSETSVAAPSAGSQGAAAQTASPTTQVVSRTGATQPAGSVNPLLQRTAKILCLGDSMTRGSEADPASFRSYRGRLYAMLRDAGYAVDFVGTQQQVPAIGGDPDHDGYGGAFIGPGGSSNNLADRLPGIVAATEPDVVVLAFGWNSVYNEPAVAGVRYRDFVLRLAAMRPEAHLVVATLSPQRGQSEAQTANELPGFVDLNATARALAAQSASDRIHLADLAAAGFVASDYFDAIHWLQPGGDRAARAIYNALVNGPLKRP